MRTFGAAFETQRDLARQVSGASQATPSAGITAVFHFVAGDVTLSEGELWSGVKIISSLGSIGAIGRRALDGSFDLGAIQLAFANAKVDLGSGDLVPFSSLFAVDLPATIVDFYMLLGGESEILTSGIAGAPSNWGYRDGTLQIRPLELKWLTKNVLRIVDETTFPNARETDIGQPIGRAIGDARAMVGRRLENTKNYYTLADVATGHLTVSSIGDIYYDGVVISEDDIRVDSTGIDDNDTFNFVIDRPTFFWEGRSYGVRPFSLGGWDMGGFTPQSTPWKLFEYRTETTSEAYHGAIIQPFRIPANARHEGYALSGITAVAKRTPGAPGTLVGIADEDSAESLFNAAGVMKERIAYLHRTAMEPQSPEVIDDQRPTVIPFPNSPIRRGKQYYAVFHHNAEFIEDDSENQETTLYGDASGGVTTMGSMITEENTSVELDPLWIDDGGPTQRNGHLSLRFHFYPITPASQQLASDGGSDNDASEGTFSQVIRLTEGRVITHLGGRFRKHRGVPMEGSVRVTFKSVDDNNEETPEISVSARVTAAQINAISGSGYEEVVSKIAGDVPMMLVPPGLYRFSYEGEIDELTQRFVGPQMRGIPTFGGAGSGMQVVHTGTVHPLGPWTGGGGNPMYTTDAEPVTFDFVARVLKYTKETSASDPSGATVARVKLYVEDDSGNDDGTLLDDAVEIRADVTANHSRLDQVVDDLLGMAGVPDARIDTAGSFAAAGAAYASAGDRMDGAVSEQQSYKQLITRLCFEGRSHYDWQWDKAQLRRLKLASEITNGDVVMNLTLAEIARSSPTDPNPEIRFGRTEDNETMNVIDVRYDFDPIANEYDAKVRRTSPGSISVHEGELAASGNLLDFKYVRDAGTAARTADYRLDRHAYSKRLPMLTTFVPMLGLERDDVVTLDLTTPIDGSTSPGGLGGGGLGEGGIGGLTPGEAFDGWKNKKAIVEDVRYDWVRRPAGVMVDLREL